MAFDRGRVLMLCCFPMRCGPFSPGGEDPFPRITRSKKHLSIDMNLVRDLLPWVRICCPFRGCTSYWLTIRYSFPGKPLLQFPKIWILAKTRRDCNYGIPWKYWSSQTSQNSLSLFQKCPADVVLKSYSWVKEQRSAGNGIVSGNHSQIENDIFKILLRGNQPLIIVLPRGL